MQVAAPSFKFEWNPNTIVMLLGFAGGLIAWGYTLAKFEQDSRANTLSNQRIEMRVERLEDNSSLMSNHELRITTLEKQALETAGEIRSAVNTLNELSSDVRLATEILRRIESAQTTQQRRDAPPPVRRRAVP